MPAAIERRLAKLETAHRRGAGTGGQYRDLPLDQPARIQRIVGILSGAFEEGVRAPQPPLTAEEERRVERIIQCLDAET